MQPFVRLLLLALAIAALSSEAAAQGKRKGHEDRHRSPIAQQGHPKKARKVKVYTSDEAVDVTRIVLRHQGYELIRVDRRQDARIVYYRRGNMGHGKGKGPVAYMVIRPGPERIVIERAPSPLLMQINVRLGY